jgi:flagellar FliJ protein
MKRFKFNLEKVLEIKEIEEKVIQKDLLLIQHQIKENEKIITNYKEKISCEKNNVTLLSSKLIKQIEIMTHYKYIDSCNAEIERLKQIISQLRTKETKLKNSLLEKSKERRTLERLKEIKFEEFKKQYNKQEQNTMDEISIQNHKLKIGGTQ